MWIEDEGLVERLLLAKNDPPKATLPAASPIVVRTDDAPRHEAPPVPQFIPLADFLQFAERVAQQNAADDHWNEKTQRQARSSAAPFVHSWSRISASRKGFEVCRLRDIPIIAFINKIDPEGPDPLALLDEIASGLALDLTVLTWPIGMGVDLTKLLFVHANLGRQTRQFESVAATQLAHEMTEHGSRLAHLRSSRGHGRADGRSLR